MKRLLAIIFLAVVLLGPSTVQAQPVEEYFKAEVTESGGPLRLQAIDGSLAGQDFEITHKDTIQKEQQYKAGDKLIVLLTPNPQGVQFTVVDYVRSDALLGLFAVFVIVAIVVGRKWAVASLVGMGYSFLIIFSFILPRIINGGDPVFNAIVGSSLIVPVTFYLSHGINHKTHIAIVSTIFTLVVIGLLSALFIDLAHLTGYAQEEAIFLSGMGDFNMRGILLAGIIIGALGILDDITISQSSVVSELRATDPKMPPKKLYQRAINVGRDHIASLVNTLVLVYAGASLPLLLLFTESGRPFLEIINIEMVADEIVRTLVGSVGLILAVPLTTFIAVFMANKKLWQ